MVFTRALWHGGRYRCRMQTSYLSYRPFKVVVFRPTDGNIWGPYHSFFRWSVWMAVAALGLGGYNFILEPKGPLQRPCLLT